MTQPIRIQLLANNSRLIEKWAGELSGERRQLIDESDPRGPSIPDVIVSDHNPLAELPDAICQQLADGKIGLIIVGTQSLADVVLPMDYTRREIRLATSLLSEVVRMRRQFERQRRQHNLLRHLALSDAVTGLANRRAWDERWATCRNRDDITVAVMDLDNFKQINDEYGHLVGDDVLKTFGQALIDGIGIGDFVARLGGDEFGMMLSGLDCESAVTLIDQSRRNAMRQVAEARLPEVTASAGVATAVAGRPEEDLFQAADQALCQAKLNGRSTTLAR